MNAIEEARKVNQLRGEVVKRYCDRLTVAAVLAARGNVAAKERCAGYIDDIVATLGLRKDDTE